MAANDTATAATAVAPTASSSYDGPGEWDLDRVDAGAYLQRIGVDGPLTASADTLRRLHLGHIRSIGFENVDVFLGGVPDLDIGAIQDKLVARGRGGYCYEHNLLFSAVLERTGFTVTRLLARVQMGSDAIRPRTHMCLLVEHDGDRWLADVGFGSQTLREPITYRAGATAVQDGWGYRLATTGSTTGDLARLQAADGPDRWLDLYVFDEVAQHHVDIGLSNHYTATHPQSRFIGRLIAQHRGDDERHVLIDTELTTTTVDGAVRRTDVAPDRVPDLLASDFGIRLSPHEAAAVVDRLTT
ncbi:MAG: arylamine N-acetyltransferase [Actinomycetota bacterium]|nr:arylamine N-acetyltransferase [Actinomycetota bacterium]